MGELERIDGFERWLGSEPGQRLALREREVAASLLPARYYPVAAQFGAAAIDLLGAANARNRVHLSAPGAGLAAGRHRVASDFHALPLGHHAVDLAILPHTLDFVSDPHALLRELHQVMVPDGTLLLSCFQPVSLWGLRKWLRIPADVAPWNGHFFSPRRVQDWLSLMGFRVLGGKITVYRPPVAGQRLYERLALLEKAGDRWWPMFGAVYIIVARLETLRMVPLKPVSKPVTLRPRSVQPAPRRSGVAARTPGP